MATEKAANPMKVVTSKVRFSYSHVFVPEAIEEGADPKYSVAILFPKTDKTLLKRINAAIEAARQEGKQLWGGSIPAKLKLPLRDGDEEYPDDEAYQGMYFFNATSKTKPGVVDANCNPIIDQSEFYSGCYGRASVKFYPFNKAVNRGVAVALNHVQKLVDGPSLSSISTAEEDFSEPYSDPLLG